MELIEFILFQPHLAAKILVNLSFSEILELVDVNVHFSNAVASYLRQIDSFHIKFSKFQNSYMNIRGNFLSSKSNLKTLRITLDEKGDDDEAMTALCKLILRNISLKKIQIKPYFQLSDQLLLTIGFMSKLESLELLANGFSDPCDDPSGLLRFYSNISRNCRSLRRISIKQFIDDPSLATLVSLPRLTSIDIVNCDVTDEGVCKLVFASPYLERIHLANTAISERTVNLIACKCSALKELSLVNAEEMNDVRCVVEVLKRCPHLLRFKLIQEDWNLMVEFDETSMGFTVSRRGAFHGEYIIASLRERLRNIRKLRINGMSTSRVLFDVVRTSCQNLHHLVVLNEGLRSVREADDLDESGFVVEVCERNCNLSTFHYDACKLTQKACEVLASESRRITSVRIKLQQQLSTECRNILEKQFENRSRNLHLFLGERKQELHPSLS